MLVAINYITTLTIIFTGLYVLGRGDWGKFGLKYAAVCLSTIAAVWLLAMAIYTGKMFVGCSLEKHICLTYAVYGIARNIAFIIFHIVIGRDVINFKRNKGKNKIVPIGDSQLHSYKGKRIVNG